MSLKKMYCFVIIIALMLNVSGCGRWKNLLALSSSQGKMAKEMKVEKRNYLRVNKAIKHRKLKKGTFGKAIKNKYGEPVVIVFQKSEKTYRWVYKPSADSFFVGEKIYLFFNEDSKLVGWKKIEQEAKPEKDKE